MYKFTVKRGYLTVEDTENPVTAVVSCYGLDISDDYSFTSEDDNTVTKFVKDHMKDSTEILVWCESEDKWAAYNIHEYLESHGAKGFYSNLYYFAENKEHFDSWFTEHEKFIDAVLSGATIRNDTLMCNNKDKSMWVHRAIPVGKGANAAWIISQMLPNGKIIMSFRTKPALKGCGDWYKCVRHQKEMADLFQHRRLNNIGYIPNKFEGRSFAGWATMDE